MALYEYRAADPTGKLLEGTMEAEAEQSVVARLHEMGYIPVQIALPGEVRSQRSWLNFTPSFERKVNQWQLLHFTQELATLVGAGLPLDRALSVLSNLVEGDEFRKAVRQLLEKVRAGKSLSAALAEHPRFFPKIYVNMIRAGEAGGVLDNVLRQLAEYLERSLELKEEIKSALTYPVVLGVVASFSLLVLFVYVIPRFALIFEDVNQALPWITRLVIGFSEALSRYGWIVLALLFVGGILALFYVRTPEGKLQWDRFRLRVWVVGDLLRKVDVARFSRTLSALLSGGVPVLDALGTVRGIMGNRIIELAIGKVQTRVREGKGMVEPLNETGVFPPLALHMIAVGEETGKLETMLANVASHYDQEVKRATRRLISMLEPALILSMGVIIGLVVLSMLLAIFSINDLPF